MGRLKVTKIGKKAGEEKSLVLGLQLGVRISAGVGLFLSGAG